MIQLFDWITVAIVVLDVAVNGILHYYPWIWGGNMSKPVGKSLNPRHNWHLAHCTDKDRRRCSRRAPYS